MIDLAQATAECREWGIHLRDWMELRTHVHGNLDSFEDFNSDSEKDERWRGLVAQVLIEKKLFRKANAYIECCRYGVRFQCKGQQAHNLFFSTLL
jgi:hypothetical protein